MIIRTAVIARFGLSAAFLLIATSVWSQDILTNTDWKYLNSKGYTKESYGLIVTTAEECKHLHNLINDPKTSGKRKDDAIIEFIFMMDFDKTITAGKSQTEVSERGPCKN